MSTDTTPAPAATETPAAEPETTSLQEHAELYGPPDPSLDAEAKAKNEEARAKVRHRARSQQASPEDAPRIQELTKRLRETEAERDALKTPAAALPVPDRRPAGTAAAPVAAREAVPASETPPTRPKPSVDEIGTTYDTYEAYIEDLTDWKSDQREAARQAAQEQAQRERQQSEAQQSWAKAHATYGTRLTAFTADHADFPALLEAHGQVNIPAAPYRAILDAETGPAWVYHLMQHPDQLAELALLFDGKAATPEFVAHATRWLSSRAQNGTAAPQAAPALALAPRPPNPVRTGPAHTDTEGPGDDTSLAAHEKAYGKRWRR